MFNQKKLRNLSNFILNNIWLRIALYVYLPAGEESEHGCPEGAAGEAVDDEVDARVEHEEKVFDTGERGRGRGESIHSDLVLHCPQQDEENKMKFVSFCISNSNPIHGS